MIEPIYLQQLPKTLHKLKKNLYSDPQIRKQTNRPEGLEITTVLRKGYEGAVRLDVLFKISRISLISPMLMFTIFQAKNRNEKIVKIVLSVKSPQKSTNLVIANFVEE